MANPQIEDGYTKIANELLEAIYKVSLSDYEHRIFWFIVRKTYGYKKKVDWIAQKQIVEETGICKPNVSRTIKKLLGKNMITREGKKIGIQKDYENWKLSKEITITKPEKLSKEISKVISTDTKVINLDNKKLSLQIPTKDIKDNIQNKTIQNKDITPYKTIIEKFNSICLSLPKIETLTDKRKVVLRIRFKKYGLDKILNIFTKAEASNFLTNRNGKNDNNWNASFDWLLNENNMVKVLEGNYDNKNKEDWKNF